MVWEKKIPGVSTVCGWYHHVHSNCLLTDIQAREFELVWVDDATRQEYVTARVWMATKRAAVHAGARVFLATR